MGEHESAPWWTKAVVYQIYPRSFADASGDGVGDLGGVRKRIDHLVDLGVDVVWLSPVYRSPQADNGYDISDYEDIDPLFGTIDEFDALLCELHSHGIKLMMDLVVNHTSDQHPWFQAAKSSAHSPKHDWYIWRKPAGNAEPNLWRSAFGGPAWSWNPQTQEYFLHMFTPQQPDLNWENRELRDAVYAMMNAWLDRGVDGFRMDVIDHIAKSPADLDDPDSARYVMQPTVHEYLHEMHERVFAGRDAELVTVGEMPGVTIPEALQFTDPERGELDMVFQFEHVDLDHGPTSKFDNIPLKLPDLKLSLARWQEGLADGGWNSLYFGNHDQPRAVTRFGGVAAGSDEFRYEAATALATVLHLQRGTPYIYQGEEIGMTNAGFASVDEYRDIESLNRYRSRVGSGDDESGVLDSLAFRSRDNARTPIPWDGSAGAGFSAATPWIGFGAGWERINVAADRAAGDRSVFDYYRRLIDLRHRSEVIQLGRFELLEPDDETLWAFTRTLGSEQLVVVANFAREPRTLPAAIADRLGTVILGNRSPSGKNGDTPSAASAPSAASTDSPDSPTDNAVLAPWEARVHRAK
jgi:oligo-1,6-glucosidase